MKSINTTHESLKPSASVIQRIAFHLSNKVDVKGIASALCLAFSTAYFWVKRFSTEGIEGLKYRKRGRPTGSGRLLSPEQEESIKGLIIGTVPMDYELNYATWTRRAIAELVKIKFKVDVKERTMGDYLKRWHMSPQKPVKQAYQRDPLKVEEWVSKTFKAIKRQAEKIGAVLFFGDEACAQTHDSNGKSYSPIGQKPIIKINGSKYKINIISAISPSGLMRYMTYVSSMNSKLFIKFINQLLASANGSMIYFIVDNLKVHRSKLVAKFLEVNSDKIKVFYLPPYCPDLNPDEYLNNIIKQKFRALSQPKTKDELSSVVSKILKRLQKKPDLIKRIFLKKEIEYVSK